MSKVKIIFFVWGSLFLFSFVLIKAEAKIKVTELRCQSATDPVGIDCSHPSFSWVEESPERGQKQAVYQIIVADKKEIINQNKGNFWDSGKVNSDQSSGVQYQGKSLQSSQTYYWKVMIWDKLGNAAPFSVSAQFTTSILDSNLWQAKWIGEGTGKDPINGKQFYDLPIKVDTEGDSVHYQGNSLLLRKEFVLPRSVAKAIVHIGGLGLYELTINGERIGDKVLNPAKTDYNKVVLYDSYVVSDYLKAGRNVLGIMLGNGWYNPLPKWWSWRMQWFGEKRAMLQLHITYNDGSSQIIKTDDTWKIAEGPVRSHCIYDGEIYDATKECENWDKPGFDDTIWKHAKIVNPPQGKLISQVMPAIKRIETLKPISVTYSNDSVSLVDFGQNFSGWIRIKLKGGKQDSIIFRYAEDINNGKLDPTSNHKALVKDIYISAGKTGEIYEPRFTYHGFQYVAIRGLNYPVLPADIEGICIHSAVKPVGTFECSNQQINKIHNAILWSQRANLMGYPTDCPQREERLGWMGDAHVIAEEAIYNFDMNLFYKKFLNDIKLNQNFNGDISFIAPRPVLESGSYAWSSAYHLITWYHYLNYGDVNVLKDNYESMKKYLDYVSTQANGFILPKDLWGDWSSPDQEWKRGLPVLTSTGYYYYITTIVAKAAQVLGFKEDAKKYGTLALNIKAAFNHQFYHSDEKNYENGSQFANSFALFLGVVPDKEKEAVMKNLVQDILVNNNAHLSTGILGTKYLMELLSFEGRSDIAWKLASQTTYPGWIHMLGNRTTLSEHWKEGGMNSHNHVMFGSIDTWFYKILGGIQSDEDAPGFKNIIIKPYMPADLSWIKASVVTVKGKVSSEWKKNKELYTLKVTIPVGSEATVYVLANNPDQVTEGNIPVKNAKEVVFLRMENNYAVFHVGSGEYCFNAKRY